MGLSEVCTGRVGGSPHPGFRIVNLDTFCSKIIPYALKDIFQYLDLGEYGLPQ